MSKDFGEDRGQAGPVETRKGLDFRSRGQVLRDFAIAVALALAFVAVVFWFGWPSFTHIAAAIVVFSLYCAAAFLVRVRPSYDEIGVSGSIDHPLRAGGGYNRILINLAVAFALGRFIAVGLVDGLRLLKKGKLPQERFMEELESRSSEELP